MGARGADAPERGGVVSRDLEALDMLETAMDCIIDGWSSRDAEGELGRCLMRALSHIKEARANIAAASDEDEERPAAANEG